MGYRNYIGFIPKKEYNKIKKLSKEELYTFKGEDLEDGYVSQCNLVTELYEFGKYCDFETKGVTKPFFKNKELQKTFEDDTEFYVVDKMFLQKVIENYQEKIKTYYSKMVNPIWNNENGFIKTKKTEYGIREDKYTFDFSNITVEEQTALYEMMSHVHSMSFEWRSQLKPFDLNKGDEITISWKYEYNIFELVRIYKSFDWKKNIMVYYGY